MLEERSRDDPGVVARLIHAQRYSPPLSELFFRYRYLKALRRIYLLILSSHVNSFVVIANIWRVCHCAVIDPFHERL
jgi:hypothetical protein